MEKVRGGRAVLHVRRGAVRKRVVKLRAERLEKGREEIGPGADSGVGAAEVQPQQAFPLVEALEGLAEDEGEEGELELGQEGVGTPGEVRGEEEFEGPGLVEVGGGEAFPREARAGVSGDRGVKAAARGAAGACHVCESGYRWMQRERELTDDRWCVCLWDPIMWVGCAKEGCTVIAHVSAPTQ